MTEIMVEKEDKVKRESMKKHTLVLFNDNEHDMTYVISCLIGICQHEPFQAEQCTLIAHHNGKCEVKIGTMPYLRSLNTRLAECGLTTEIH